MKALRLHGERGTEGWRSPRVAVETIAPPTPRPGELLVRVRYCGVCGSDFHMAEALGPEARLAYPGLATLPVTLGHEVSGTVEGYGPGTRDSVMQAFPLGSAVTAEEMQWCGECSHCRAGHFNHCSNLEELGFTVNGAHSELVCVPARYCWSLAPLLRLGEEATYRLGALVEPYSVSFRALFQGTHAEAWMPGLRVLVIGSGPIGLAAVDLARAAGALLVDVLEHIPARRALALKMGAAQALSPTDWERLGENYDWILDAAGAPSLALEIAGKKLGVAGTICLLARTHEPAPLAPEALITRNARIVGSQGHSGEGTFQRVIELMAHGRLRALELVEEVVGLEEAMERLRLQKKSGGKILVKPN